MANTNDFDNQVLDNIVPGGSNRATMSSTREPTPKPEDEKPPEKKDIEFQVYMNGKNLQVAGRGKDIHFVNKEDASGLSITEDGNIIMVTGSGGSGNACGGKLLINSQNGQLIKSGAVVAEYTADTTGDEGRQTKKGEAEGTTAARENPARSVICYGDDVEEVLGEKSIKGENIHINATDTLYLEAGTKIVITSGKEGSGAVEIQAGELIHNVQTLIDNIKSAHMRIGVPETTNLQYDPRSNTSTIGLHSLNTNIAGDLIVGVGGRMRLNVTGATAPTPALLAKDPNPTTGLGIDVAAGDFSLNTKLGSALFAIGGIAFPDELKPGSFSMKATTGVGISAGELPKLPELSAGDVNISSLTSTTIDATTEVNVKALTGVTVETAAKDVAIKSVAGNVDIDALFIYLN